MANLISEIFHHEQAKPAAAPTPQPAAIKETTVSTVPTPAPVAAPPETKLQKFENILNGIGRIFQDTENAIINVTGAEASVIKQFLPPSLSTPILAAQQLAAASFAAMEATEQQIGASAIPYAQKVTAIIALQGAAIAKVLAAAGLESGQAAIQTIITGATGWATIGKITGPPTPPASA